MKKLNVPFYSNTPDNMRCVPAVFKMVLKYFQPDKEYSWKELDKLTEHKDDKGTWVFPALTKLKKQGFEIVKMGSFDLQKFYKQGEKYMREFHKPEVAEWYLTKSDVLDKREEIPEHLEAVKPQQKIPTEKDIVELLEKGHLVATDINARILNDKPGYSSHFVLIIGYDDRNFIIHDPGLPSYKSRIVPKEKFKKAWYHGGKSYASLTAFKYGKS